MERVTAEQQQALRRINSLNESSIAAVQQHFRPEVIRALRKEYIREREAYLRKFGEAAGTDAAV